MGAVGGVHLLPFFHKIDGADAGFDPQGFVGMFGKLQQAAGLNDNGAFPYLRYYCHIFLSLKSKS